MTKLVQAPMHRPDRSPVTARDGHPGPATMRIALLGGFRIARGESEIAERTWRLQKAKHLVQLLALTPGRRLTREQLLDLLWPDLEPTAAAKNFHYALHIARRALGAEVLPFQHGVLALVSPGPLWIDVEAFEAAARAARATEDPALYHEALALYTGDLLPEARYEDWAAAQREALRATQLDLLLAVASLHEARGEYAAASDAFTRAVAQEPAAEAAHLGLMRLYALQGQRGRALRQWVRLTEALRRELDVEPAPASRELYTAILNARFPPRVAGTPPPPQPRRHNLPAALTSFIGRARELAELKQLLTRTRLLTLVGPGGCGKTRLALATAETLVEAFADGVWLAELAGLTEPALVPQAVVTALGIREQPGRTPIETLVDALRTQARLLVLDNCEHVIEACTELVATLLAACPGLRVLATSRAVLRVPGELVWRVPSLPLPEALPTVASVDQLARLAANEAVQLFVDRLRWRQPAFALTSDNAGLVSAVCRRLDGLPLALELAAARGGVLTVAQLAARLDRALGLLTDGGRTAPSRQQTLRATLDWSYDLLMAYNQRLLCQMAVFTGGWTLAGAEAVRAGEEIAAETVLSGLADLVDQSLVLVEDGGTEARYRLLEPVRQYAWERLVASGEAEEYQARHARYYLALAEEAEPQLTGSAQAAWLARLDREHDNLRAALRWAIGHGEAMIEGQLCAALFRFWYVRGYLSEGVEWLAGALGRVPAVGASAPLRARLLRGAGTLAWAQGEQRTSLTLMEEAYALFRALDDRVGIAATLHNLGVLAEWDGDFTRARALFEECLELRRALDDTVGMATTLQTLGNVARQTGEFARATAYYQESLTLHRRAGNLHGAAMALGGLGNIGNDTGDLQRAVARFTEALALFREMGDTASIALTLHNLGSSAVLQGAFQEATARQAEALRLFLEIGDRRGITVALDGLGMAAARQGQWRCAVHFFGAAARLREESGIPIAPAARPHVEGLVTQGREAVGTDAFTVAWREGQERALETLLAEALTPPAVANVDAADSVAAGLSPREREIATLIARNLTNRQIAAALGIAERTVDTHVSKILRKLGVTSRAQIVARTKP